MSISVNAVIKNFGFLQNFSSFHLTNHEHFHEMEAGNIHFPYSHWGETVKPLSLTDSKGRQQQPAITSATLSKALEVTWNKYWLFSIFTPLYEHGITLNSSSNNKKLLIC